MIINPVNQPVPKCSMENTHMKLVEPPSCSSPSSRVFVGQNSRSQWVVQEQNGLFGGLFVNRAEAIKYARVENGRHPETVVELSREIELDMGSGRFSSERKRVGDKKRAA
jgi:hypothetical protein